MDYKTGKLIEIVREFLGNNQNKFEINGVDLSRTVFMYRKKENKFEPIPKGNYHITTESNNTYINIDDEIRDKAYEYQIIYENTLESSSYDDNFPELDVLVQKYNVVVKDIEKLAQLLATNGIKADTLKMSQILTPLEPNTFWGADESGAIINMPIGDLNSKYEKMLEKLKVDTEGKIATQLESGLNNIMQETTERLEEIKRRATSLKEDIETLSNSKKSAIETLSQRKTNEFEALSNTKENEISTLSQNQKNEIILLSSDKKTEIENRMSALIQQFNQLSSGFNAQIIAKKQEAIDSLSNIVMQYLNDNKEQLRGEKGDGITSIKPLANNKIEINYGSGNKVVVSVGNFASVKSLTYQNNILTLGLTDGTSKQVEIKTQNKPVEVLWEGEKDLSEKVDVWGDDYDPFQEKETDEFIVELPIEWKIIALQIGDILDFEAIRDGGPQGPQNIMVINTHNRVLIRTYDGGNVSFVIKNNKLYLINKIGKNLGLRKVSVIV